MARQKSINGSKKILKALNTLMKDLDKKVSIRVGIIGEQAYAMAHLGAIHEFGATIQVTEKMRAYLHHIGIHLKPETTTITIPARSFLRATLLNSEAKRELLDIGGISQKSDFYKGTVSAEDVRQFNKEKFEQELIKNPDFFINICNAIGARALNLVQIAFEEGGKPDKWQPISDVTKKQRLSIPADPNNPPLQATGDLMESISFEVKEVR